MNPDSIGRSTQLRTDIQALRGLAVLAVIFYHLDIGLVPAGYLGVDIFFVISGFLITSLVIREMEAGTFTLSTFYFRRAKRLLPAAYSTILLTVVLAPWFLGQNEIDDLRGQVVAAMTFTANHHFLGGVGYFSPDSERMPLLHMWSLSLEEQYYLLIPGFLLLLRRTSSRRRIAIGGLCLASLILCVFMPMEPSARFYLLPTRAWELLIGSLGAIWASDASRPVLPENPPHARFGFPISVIALLGMLVLPLDLAHPGGAAFIACSATLFILVRNHQESHRLPGLRYLARVGDISYSLYLIHWPIIAFIRNAWLGEGVSLPWELRLMAFVLSLVLGYTLFRCVESPLHRATIRPTRGLITGAVAASIALIVGSFWITSTGSAQEQRRARMVNFGLGLSCDTSTDFVPLAECRTSDTPTLLIWGDSFAMHLVSGFIANAGDDGVAQATRSSCGPALTIGSVRENNPVTGPIYDRDFAVACMAFNASVLDYIRHNPSISTVVLAGAFRSYVDSGWTQLTRDSITYGATIPSAVPLAAEALAETAREIQRAGKKVLVVAPPPVATFDVGACLERLAKSQWTLGLPAQCAIPSARYRMDQRNVLALVDALAASGIPVLRLADYLCDASICQTQLNGTNLYRDSHHLSHAGSKELASRMEWGKALQDLAR